MNNSHFSNNDNNDKYQNYMIISAKHRTPPYEWSDGIFQRFKPVSGDFKLGNNFFGNEICVNNQTGRGYFANPCGYWNEETKQFNSGTTHNNLQMNGSLFPIGHNKSYSVMSNPQDRTIFGYARIGEEIRNK